jgi:hypothetical protein
MQPTAQPSTHNELIPMTELRRPQMDAASVVIAHALKGLTIPEGYMVLEAMMQAFRDTFGVVSATVVDLPTSADA